MQIIIETVGVGQSEVAVSKITDFFLLLMLAGAGDELQGIKRGIMEMADSIVITKADGTNLAKAKAAKTEFAQAIHYLQLPESGFIPKVETCSSIENKGITEVFDLIEKYKTFAIANGYFAGKRKAQQYELVLNTIEEQLKLRFYSDKKIKKIPFSRVSVFDTRFFLSAVSPVVVDVLTRFPPCGRPHCST